ncbi:hypothetical protein MHBO_002110 [Bonamia ostreae]|uniref:Protein kinase domain-containing protein n=1 Tax=Bonamia ostreae TaxID=126728 RepID=A0ABV2AL75_9EUKA
MSVRKTLDLELSSSDSSKSTCCFEVEGHVDCKETLSNYLISRTIRENGKNKIFEVEDKSNNQFVAKMSKAEIPNAKIFADNEVRILEILHGHDKIVSCKHVFKTFTQTIIIEERLSHSLADQIEKDTNMNKKTNLIFISVLAKELAEVLRHMHTKQVLHADLTSENVMFDKNGNLKLSDFDLSIAKENKLSIEVKGSPLFMAPEQTEGICTEKTDWFGLGMVLYDYLCGSTPNAEFIVLDDNKGYPNEEKTMKAIRENRQDFILNAKAENQEVADLANRCLKFNAKDRIDLDSDEVFSSVPLFQNITSEKVEEFKKFVTGFKDETKVFIHLF